MPNLHRIQEIRLALEAGKTLQEVGNIYALSRERIRQIRKKHMPDLEKGDWGCSLKTTQLRKEKREYFEIKYGRSSFIIADEYQRAFSLYFSRKKQNAKSTKWEFTLQMSDVTWNTHCPILGMEIDWFAETRNEASPSLDRIDTNLGYIPGNVELVSWRANRIKNDGTAEEHLLIAEYMKRQEIKKEST